MNERLAVLLAAGVLGFFGGTPQLFGQSVQIYSSGDFKDPSASIDWPADLLGSEPTLAESFSLPAAATLDGVNLWTYDTFDGSSGDLRQAQYAIYTGSLQPSGSPIASGFGSITRTTHLLDHVFLGGGDNEWYTIATSFNVATPVRLDSGLTYWLALKGSDLNPAAVNAVAVWANANAAGGSYLVQNGSGWDSFSGERAFVLTGEFLSVPEPSTLALLGIGTCGLWMLCRRRSR